MFDVIRLRLRIIYLTENIHDTQFTAIKTTFTLLWHACASSVRATFDVDCTNFQQFGSKKEKYRLYNDIHK